MNLQLVGFGGSGRPASSRRIIYVLVAFAILFAAEACSRPLHRLQVVPGEPPSISELWQEPLDLEQRDLFHGAGGAELAPADTTFQFVARDTSGWSPGFDVVDGKGVEWSVKLGPEAQSEVVSSRILWAIGFHQPPTYYLERWHLTGVEAGPQPAGRFRPERSTHRVVGEWSWYENPFIGSRPYRGLVVVNLVLNSWDWKTSNNKIYRDVIDSVTPSDVRWTCQLLSRLSERQWRDAFRAAGYQDEHATRYIDKIKEKIAAGLSLTASLTP